MKKRLKGLLSLWLAVAMAVAMLPVPALAAWHEADGGHGGKSLSEVTPGATGITLASENYYLPGNMPLSADIIVPAGVTATLCLNGKTLSRDSSDSYGIYVEAEAPSGEGAEPRYGSLTICNCNGTGTVACDIEIYSDTYDPDGESVTIGGMVTISGGEVSGMVSNEGTLTISGGGKVSGEISNDGVMTISGGEVSDVGFIRNYGVLTISGGGKVSGVIYNHGGALEIAGGEISDTGKIDSNNTLTISGGTLEGTIISENRLEITGGVDEVNGKINAKLYIGTDPLTGSEKIIVAKAPTDFSDDLRPEGLDIDLPIDDPISIHYNSDQSIIEQIAGQVDAQYYTNNNGQAAASWNLWGVTISGSVDDVDDASVGPNKALSIKSNTCLNDNAIDKDGNDIILADIIGYPWLVLEPVFDNAVIYKYEYGDGVTEGDANFPALPLTGGYEDGETVTVASNPSMTGYTFSGWSSNDVTVNGGTFIMPDTPVTFRGTWRKNASYTVEHYFQNISDDGYTLDENKTQTLEGVTGEATAATALEVSGFTAKTVQQQTIAADGETVVEVKYDRNTYIATFDADGGTWADGATPKTVSAKFDAPISPPTNPTRDGYDFGGWDPEVPAAMPAENVTITALWTRNGGNPPGWSPSGPTYYTITVEETEDGAVKSNYTRAPSGRMITLTATPEEGYALSVLTVTDTRGREIEITGGDGGVYTFRMPSSDVTVTAAFASTRWDFGYRDCPKDHTCPIWPYTDAETTAWYHDGVHFCLENGLMVGYGNNIFKPHNSTSRTMLAVMLWRLSDSPVVNYALDFEDVAADDWYTEAIRWAKSVGVVEGHGNGYFGLDDDVTREQMVTILWRYAQYMGYDVSIGEETNILSYNDAFDVSGYAIPATQWACGSGIVVGKEDDEDDGMLLDPKGSTTRAQMATIMMRFCEMDH